MTERHQGIYNLVTVGMHVLSGIEFHGTSLSMKGLSKQAPHDDVFSASLGTINISILNLHNSLTFTRWLD